MSLDALYWNPGWVASDNAEFDERVTEVALESQWIMDGNYTRHGAGELRRQRCDTIIWFDLPRRTCMLGIIRRIVGSHGQVRPEMAPGCPEKIDLEFFRYVWTYRRLQRPKLLQYFEGLRSDQALISFTNRAQANDYLTNAGSATPAVSVH